MERSLLSKKTQNSNEQSTPLFYKPTHYMRQLAFNDIWPGLTPSNHAMGKLQQALAKYTSSTKKRKAIDQEQDAGRKSKKNTRIVWHLWSDSVRTEIPYRVASGTCILLVGDGDFSFSASLLDHGMTGENLICTGHDNETSLIAKYPRFDSNISKLRDVKSSILLGFDATKMSLSSISSHLFVKADKLPIITAVVFNFPHTGEGIKDRQHNIAKQQKLIVSFLQCTTDLLKAQELAIKKRGYSKVTRKTIMAADRPTDLASTLLEYPNIPQPEIHLTCWEGDPYDDWNIRKLASSIPDLHLEESFSFDPARYAGYEHCRTIGHVKDDDTFITRPARTFVFILKPAKSSFIT